VYNLMTDQHFVRFEVFNDSDYETDVSEELSTSFIRVTRIGAACVGC
jgi:hypothetical protein